MLPAHPTRNTSRGVPYGVLNNRGQDTSRHASVIASPNFVDIYAGN